MIAGIVPHRKLVSTRGSKVTVELPVIEYIADQLANHYRTSTTYLPVEIKVLIINDEDVTNAIANVLIAIGYDVDIVSRHTLDELDVLFVPAGYSGEVLRKAAKIVEY